MRITRIYHNGPLVKGTEVQLDEQAAHHLARVLRVKIGTNCTLFNGHGGEFDATITQISKKSVTAEPTTFHDENCQSPIDIHLVQAISRTEKMDLIIQKATELGVTEITPIIAEFSAVKFSQERANKRIEHWMQIIISACEQSGRNILPRLNPIISFNDFIETAEAENKLIFHTEQSCHPERVQRVEGSSQSPQPDKLDISKSSFLLLIGPEGGFSDNEVERAKMNHFELASLGPRILRMETAAIAAISVIQNRFGDLS